MPFDVGRNKRFATRNYVRRNSLTRYFPRVIESFGDSATESIYRGLRVRGLSGDIQERARRKLRMINQARIIEDLQVPPGNRLTEITKCRRSLSAETALRLAKFFGNSAAFWIGLQSEHDLEVAGRSMGARINREVVSMGS